MGSEGVSAQLTRCSGRGWGIDTAHFEVQEAQAEGLLSHSPLPAHTVNDLQLLSYRC